MNTSQRNFLIAALLILCAAAIRIVNAEHHLYNLAPVAAIALFSGAVIRNKRAAFLLPLLASLAADAYFSLFTDTPGFYGVSQAFVYAGLLAVTLLGTRMGRINGFKVAGFSIGGSLLFFLISNFGVWAAGVVNPAQQLYPATLSGLGTTYLMGLPFYSPMGGTFFWNSILGDLLFSGLLFGAFYALRRPAATTVASSLPVSGS